VSVRAVVAGLVAVLAALLPGTASAAPERGTIVVEGRGGTTTEWEQAGPLPIDVPLNGRELVGGGAYAGALFEPLDGRQSPVGAVQVRAFADETRAAVARLGVQLPPGRYRVTLFGNGPVRVVLPNNDREAPGIRIVPRTPTPVTFVGRSETLAMGYSTARVDLPGALPAGRRALQVTLRAGNEVGRSQVCATRGTECEESLLPARAPSPAPSGPTTQGAQPGASSGGPRAGAAFAPAEPAARRLLWSFEGYRDTEGKLRAAAIIF
jgi:hypothetical protein